MIDIDLTKINWTAAFLGFGVDWTFSELVGAGAIVAMLLLQHGSLDTELLSETLPPDIVLVRQIIGVLGAVVGGLVAGYVARQRGVLHGVLGSLIGLFMALCFFGLALNLGDLGFIILNLVGAGYGGGWGERWRRGRDSE